jgi:metal-sulfur cluster biosynthetic enzyme
MQEEITTDPAAETVADDSAATTDVASEATGVEGVDGIKESILEALKNVIDPELGLNIVDLGLVYDVKIDAQGDVDIQYSLTTMGCPIGPMIEDQMRGFLRGVPGVGEVRPEFVLRPPWTPEMMSDEAKAALGIF